MKSIHEQLTGREPTEEELFYQFRGVFWDEEVNDPKERAMFDLFKGRFDDERFLSEEKRKDYSINNFVFSGTFVFAYDAFGDEFRDSIDALVGKMHNTNDKILDDIAAKGKVRTNILVPGDILLYNEADNGSFYIGPARQEKLEEIRKTKKNFDIRIDYTSEGIDRAVCIVYAGDTLLFGYVLERHDAEEPESEYETRTYQIHGTKRQLDTLEQAFAYMQMLGEQGHSSGVDIGYDGDGNARMMFERDNQIPLSFPKNNVVCKKHVGEDETEITSEEFIRLVKKHKAFSWKEHGERVWIGYDFKENDRGEDENTFLID
jgi:hypothetical protein